MNSREFETTLARLYTDREFRSLFLRDPDRALAPLALTEVERSHFLAMDKTGLVMAAHSFQSKREKFKFWKASER